jgi:hypothetical protein
MAAMGHYVENGLGDRVESPTPDEMWKFLLELDVEDEEHGAAWLSLDNGFSLEWNGDGRLVLTDPAAKGSQHLRGVTRERALELWVALSSGKLDEVKRSAWQPGNGYVRTPEREAEIRAALARDDRVYYESLGAERTHTPLGTAGCSRGAIELSVLCRVHHFESVRKRPCPFND